MPILENSFTCPKGHSFTANAKLRTRCPSCGTMTKRSFKEDTPPEPKEPVATSTEPVVEKPKPSKPKGPVLIKAGKAREPRAEVRKRKSLADQIREAKENAKMAKTNEPKARVKKVSEGIVVKKRVSRNVTPRAGRRPPKTSISKVTEYGGGGNSPYWQKVAAKFTPRFGR